ncbi:MAG: acyltransferase [Leptospirales bacterium]|nr:acyltransferase [Leptospirales bacterium]
MSRITGDLFRLLAIAFVLIIHSTWRWEEAFRQHHDFLSADFVGVTLNQLARFSVPSFVFLSGYGLALKYRRQLQASGAGFDLATTLDFWRGRALRVGLPFLVWTLVFFAFSPRFQLPQDLVAGAALGEAALRFAQTLAPLLYRQGADYHFYFFHIIIECYIVFPLLFVFIRHMAPLWRAVCWVALLILQLAFSSPSHLIFHALGLERPAFFSAFLIYWIFYFYSGVAFAFAAQETRQQLESKRWMASIAVLLALALTLYEYVGNSYHARAPDDYDHFNRQVVVLLSLAVIRFFAAWDSVLQPQLLIRSRLTRCIIQGAALSFVVFLFHTWILRAILWSWPGIPLLLLIPALWIASFGLAWLLHRALPDWRLLRAALALPPADPANRRAR